MPPILNTIPHPSLQELRAAKQAARQLTANMDGVAGLGLGQDCVVVYVRNAAVGDQLPPVVNGIRVETLVTGDLQQQSR